MRNAQREHNSAALPPTPEEVNGRLNRRNGPSAEQRVWQPVDVAVFRTVRQRGHSAGNMVWYASRQPSFHSWGQCGLLGCVTATVVYDPVETGGQKGISQHVR